MRIKFIVPGTPQSKGRPRFVNRGKFVSTYTPKETVVFENMVKLAYMQVGGMKLQGAIKAEVKAYFPIPKSASKKKQKAMAEGEIKPITVLKDADNVCKAVLDALNSVAYDDDRQVVELHGYKLYSDEPRTEVVLEEFEDSFGQYMNKPEE